MNVNRYQWLERGVGALLTACVVLGCNKGSPETETRAAAATPATATPATTTPATSEPSTPVPSAGPPALPVRSLVLHPSFVGKSGPFAAGTAVPVRAPGAPSGVVVLSCHHIFGPMGGLGADVPASDLPAFIQKATVTDQDGKAFTLGPALPVAHARTFTVTTRDASGDVSVFQAPAELAPHALELAPALPQKDERVWLLARVEGQTELMWPATVFYVTDSFLVYQFDSTTISFRATSGAPVVNAKGQLVAINLGGNPVQDVVRGFGTPAPSLRRALEVALPK